MSSHRRERLSGELRDEIAQIVARGLKDPRIGFVTVTRVELSADLSHAKAFVSVLGREAQRRESLTALQHATGIKKNPGGVSTTSRERGILRTWEPIKGAPGNLGCAVVVDPADVVEFVAEWAGNSLVLRRAWPERARIEVLGRRTACEPDRFFSRRRDIGRTGRMVAFVAPLS